MMYSTPAAILRLRSPPLPSNPTVINSANANDVAQVALFTGVAISEVVDQATAVVVVPNHPQVRGVAELLKQTLQLRVRMPETASGMTDAL